MPQIIFHKHFALALITAALLSPGPAFADKPSWTGGGKHDRHRQHERRAYPDREDRHFDGRAHYDHDRPSYRGGAYFGDRQRIAIRDYYAGEFRGGHCPPGLAKKHNGCLPPGHARPWTIGRPLPPDVVYYDLPPAVALGIGPPPLGYRFVRVASDILMIAIGTGMVMDAIRDLGGM